METALAGARPLQQALRRARIESAERSQAAFDLRAAARARLDLLREALLPVFGDAAISGELFDFALAPGDPPRLFVDLVAFVEMARDQRTYRFVRDGRDGRIVLAESAEPAVLVEAVTDYVARRIVERERAMAFAPSTSAPPPAALQKRGATKRPDRADPAEAEARRTRAAVGLAFLLGLAIGIGAVLAIP